MTGIELSQVYAEGMKQLVAPKYVEEFGSKLFWQNVKTEYKKVGEKEIMYTVYLGKKFLGHLRIEEVGDGMFDVEFMDKVYQSKYVKTNT